MLVSSSSFSRKKINILGVGGCMTEGFPLPPEQGFLGHLSRAGMYVQQASWHGFTSLRAEKWVQTAVESQSSDYVVVQFGSTDASIPLAEPLRTLKVVTWFARSTRKAESVTKTVARPSHPTTLTRQALWWVEGALRFITRLPPQLKSESYAETMSRIAESIAAQATPLVLSPFVMGDPCSNAMARRHTHALRQALRAVPSAVFIDVFSVLEQYPRRDVLLADGLHLSAQGHEIVARELLRVILEGSSRPVSVKQQNLVFCA